jgi:hypothetical protein
VLFTIEEFAMVVFAALIVTPLVFVDHPSMFRLSITTPQYVILNMLSNPQAVFKTALPPAQMYALQELGVIL